MESERPTNLPTAGPAVGWTGLLGAGMGGLRGQAMRGGVWMTLARVGGQLAALLRVLILARLLEPADFGLVGVALLVMGALQVFTETGFQLALLQRPGPVRDYLDTAFGVQSLRGLILTLVTVAAAPLAGWFFQNPDAVAIMRALAFTFLIGGLANPATVLLQRDLNFRRFIVLSQTEIWVGLGTGITLALWWQNAWALVVSSLAAAVARTAVSYWVEPYQPRWRIRWAQARELAGFGRWVLGTNILGFFSTNLDSALVGRLLGTVPLGVYQMAYRIGNLPAAEMAQVFSSVAVPVYSKVQGEHDRLRKVFLQVLETTILGGAGLAVVTALLGPPAVVVFLGSKWAETAAVLPLLAGYGFLRLIAGTGGALFQGTGHPHKDTVMNAWRLAGLALLIYPLTVQWGLRGAAGAAVGSLVVPVVYALQRARQQLGLRWRELAQPLTKSMAVVGLGCAVPAALGRCLLGTTAIELVTVVAATGLVYGLLLFWLVRYQRTLFNLRQA